MPPTGRPAERHLAAVERATRVLDAFLQQPAEARATDIAQITGINPSSVSRILATLVAAGYVEHLPSTGRYRLGTHLLALANHVLAGIDVRAIARGHLTALVEETGETATLSIPGDTDAVTVDFVASAASVVSVARVGRPSVGHATAAGKVGLAFGRSVPAAVLEPLTDRTITDPQALGRALDQVRAAGWARAEGEREADLNAIAAPVFGPGAELVAILGLQGPAGRFDHASQDAAAAHLLRHAAEISRSLGGE